MALSVTSEAVVSLTIYSHSEAETLDARVGQLLALGLFKGTLKKVCILFLKTRRRRYLAKSAGKLIEQLSILTMTAMVYGFDGLKRDTIMPELNCNVQLNDSVQSSLWKALNGESKSRDVPKGSIG
jgi:hypothetical protein